MPPPCLRHGKVHIFLPSFTKSGDVTDLFKMINFRGSQCMGNHIRDPWTAGSLRRRLLRQQLPKTNSEKAKGDQQCDE